jgi:hypothetical protein
MGAMATPNRQGQTIEILISEPWELGESMSWRALVGQIEAIGTGRRSAAGASFDPTIMVRVQEPFAYRDQICEWLVGSPRYEDETASAKSQLADGQTFNFVRIPAERAQSSDPLDITWWRGGVALIGKVRLVGRHEEER